MLHCPTFLRASGIAPGPNFVSHMLQRVSFAQPRARSNLPAGVGSAATVPQSSLETRGTIAVMSSSDESQPDTHARPKMAAAASSKMLPRDPVPTTGKKRKKSTVVSASTSRSTSSSNSSTSSSDSAPTKKRKLRVGTDFSGIETLCHILERAKIKHRLMFATEKQKHLRRYIKKRFRPRWLGADAVEHQRKCTVDLYAAGAPCQPWSRAGRQQGLADEKGRGCLIYTPIEYIEHMQPRVAILENVSTLCTDGEFVDVFNNILRRLRQAGYRVHFEKINTIDHGVPQSRPRIYIVCIKRDKIHHEFQFPEKLPWTIPASALLDSKKKKKVDVSPHSTDRATNHINRAVHAAQAASLCGSHSLSPLLSRSLILLALLFPLFLPFSPLVVCDSMSLHSFAPHDHRHPLRCSPQRAGQRTRPNSLGRSTAITRPT